MRKKYRLTLPAKVIMADYDEKENDLYVRFREAEHTEGEPTSDGLVIIHRDKRGITAIEILDLREL